MAQTADGVTRQPGPLRRLRRFWRDARTVALVRNAFDDGISAAATDDGGE